MVKAKVFVLQKHFEGFPKADDLKLIEEDLPSIKNGEFLAEAVYISVDPGTRLYAAQLNLGEPFMGSQVAKIIESKNPRYPVGQHVVGSFGWRTHTISDGETFWILKTKVVPKFGDLPLSLALGVLGTTGNTAYFGFLEICTPRVGETVVITAAAGAIGSHVGQIAKIKGCKVIGVTSSDEKGKWLVNELGFDNFINYKTADVDKALAEVAPEGVDCYFDNVGGELSSIILRRMNQFGRISICGAVSAYNNTDVKEFLAEAIYISVDPGIRSYVARLNLGDTILGSQVAKIIESKNPRYPVGQHVMGNFGWRTRTISDGEQLWFSKPIVVPNFGDLPLSLALGVLGMPGNSAYFGFLEICTPRVGETVVITTAAGAIGSHVGQIAKIKGCKVIGVTSSDEKGKWLVDELGFDHFINYKTADLDKALAEAAPEGIDCYFDNVGGEMSSIILRRMNQFGRISVCGATSGYNNRDIKAPLVQGALISRNLKMEGFIFSRWMDRWNEGVQQNLKWIKKGKLKYKETVTDGFENLFTAFADLLNSTNIGKAVVKM